MAKRQQQSSQQQKPIVTFDADGSMQIHTTDPQWIKFINQCASGDDALETFAKFFFKRSFRKPFTKQRKQFARDISNPALPFIWEEASRSFGKTTLIWCELVRRLCFRQLRFIVYTMSELRLAERRTESVKNAIMSNHLIQRFFGKMNPQYNEGYRDIFGAKSWKLVDPETNESFAIVVPKSDNAVVNGLVEYIGGEQIRPDCILCDDITDRKRVHDENYRTQHMDWLFGTLFPCVENEFQPDPKTHRWPGINRGDRPPYQIMLIDTCKHAHCAVEIVSKDPEWTGAKYPAAEAINKERTLFRAINETLTDEQVQAAYDRYVRIGKENTFFREYMCEAGQNTNEGFPKTFRYYRESDLNLSERPDIVKFIIVDPARTGADNPRAAFTAMLAVGVSCRTAQVWLRGMVHDRMAFQEIGYELMAFAKRTNTHILAVEDAGLNDAIRGPLEHYAMKAGMSPYWIWLPASRKYIETDDGDRRTIKEARASAALWLYKAFGESHPHGHVWHEESLRGGPLEQQQASFPECKFWDAIDTLGYIDYVMRELGLIFERQDKLVSSNMPDLHDEWDDVIEQRLWCYERSCA